MKCPLCNVDLVMSERQGIEIDYCPQCRGVWLDRGELDKIIERSVGSAPASAREERRDYDRDRDYERKRERDYDRDYERKRDYDHDYRHDHYKKKKKRPGSFLEDLFEFGD
ncbi:MAG TPA: zf-TFIIB domain-containing protein [Candidatus Aphodovivens avistercoris]|nr:zf-TFIIB domain-containing protein [Candidatus Aphodovivens avistercoris]